MLSSTENNPPDPPCPFQFPHLKNGSDDIQRSPLPLPLSEVDLLKPPPLLHHHHTSPPNFSIRDYVFAARGKDIKKNWPFSLKNLQLCLKHGVKDPLPPFQHLDAVRNQSVRRCTVDTTPLEQQNASKLDGEPSGSDGHAVLEPSSDIRINNNLAVTCVENRSCRSGREENENDFPSTTTSVSQSEIESLPINKPSNPPLEPDTSLEASAEIQAVGPRKSQKTENSARPSSKKCRLIVKFGANSDRSSTEDIASNFTAVSESMASKVCPVCKIFSSSSNTTLNAHIDQCLSVGSTPKWTADSKVTRHRIKPRKTRLMVDVYATAKRCTLEELDRRNGTNWATTSNGPCQDTEKQETADEDKKQRVTPPRPEDAGYVGDVYVDANGTKVRILSKFSDTPAVTKLEEELVPKKSVKGCKGNKFLSTKKKNRHASKHLKYLKLAPQSRKIFCHKVQDSKIDRDQDARCRGEESTEEFQMRKQMKSFESGKLRQRVCSKRTDFVRKLNKQVAQNHLTSTGPLTQDLTVQSNKSCLGNPVMETNCAENSTSSLDNGDRMESPSFKAQALDKREAPSSRKRVRSPMLGDRMPSKVESYLTPGKHVADQLGKFGPQSFPENCASSWGNKIVVGADAVLNSDPNYNVKKPDDVNAFGSRALRSSSSKKKVQAVDSRFSMVDSSYKVLNKCSKTKNSQLHMVEDIHAEAVAWQSEKDQQYELLHDDDDEHRCSEEETSGGNIQGVRGQAGALSISRKEENTASKTLQPSSHYSAEDGWVNATSSARTNDVIVNQINAHESVEQVVTSLSKSAKTTFRELSNSYKSRSKSPQIVIDYNRPFCGSEPLTGPSGSSLVDGQQIFCADEVGCAAVDQNGQMEVALDSEEAQGNSFPEVDPIPIPGPPGSFLPSPRDMGSDDFQGNSSLTTSRVQSSQDQLDIVDGDSSDSPISAVSTISNSMAARSDMKLTETLSSVDAPDIPEESRLGFSIESGEPADGNATKVPERHTESERDLDGEKHQVYRIFTEKRPFVLKSDDQPCCCRRKERYSPSISLNFQESQLLHRRAMTSLTASPLVVQGTVSPYTRPNNFNMRTLSSSASLEPEKAAIPVTKTSVDPIAFKGSSNGGIRFLGRGESESASPSSANPILRLMGKNLMVVNKEEDATMPMGEAHPCIQNNHRTSQFFDSSELSPSVLNQDGQSLHRAMPQCPLINGQKAPHMAVDIFDVPSPTGFRSYSNVRSPQTAVQIPAYMYADHYPDRGFLASMDSYKPEAGYHFQTQQNRVENKPGPVSTYNMERNKAVSHKGKGDPGVSAKEIIVIDDAPESDTIMMADAARHSENLRINRLMSSGITTPVVQTHSLRHGNPFSFYQPHMSPLIGEPGAVHNTNLHQVPSRQGTASPVRWGCTSGGSGVLQQSPFLASSPSTGHLRSVLYYSPSS